MKKKTKRVINSCVTVEQLMVAVNYLELVRKYVTNEEYKELCDLLNKKIPLVLENLSEIECHR